MSYTKGDCISRQAAIDVVCKACQYDREDYTDCPDRSPSSLFCDYTNALRSLPSAQPEIYDYSDIDPLWNSFAEENDINLTDGAKQLKDAMWVGYRKGKQDTQPEIIRCKDCVNYETSIAPRYCLHFGKIVRKNDFCSNAERRTDATD